MECSEPGLIHDYEFTAYLAGEQVRPVVIEHLARCQHCASSMKSYMHLDKTLRRRLYLFDCPESIIIGEYQLGMLDAWETEDVRRHLANCKRCIAETASLENFLDLPLPGQPAKLPSLNNNHHASREGLRVLEQLGERVRERVRRVVAVLQPSPHLQPRLSNPRSPAAQTWPRRYLAEDIQISIQLEPDGKDALQLVGFVMWKGHDLEDLQGISVHLSGQAGGTVYTQVIDDLGNFIFPALLPATYTLELNFPAATLAIEQLTIQA